jgi:hypothetical protein
LGPRMVKVCPCRDLVLPRKREEPEALLWLEWVAGVPEDWPEELPGGLLLLLLLPEGGLERAEPEALLLL